MAATNKTLASKYAMNIADDLPLAIYDLQPNTTMMNRAPSTSYTPEPYPKVFEDETYPHPAHPTVLDDYQWSWFEVPSRHTSYISSAYYLHSHGDIQSDWPNVGGMPMVHGGAPKVRYSLLNRDVENPLPFLQIPSFGLGQTYVDRARTLEFWLETDPYASSVNANLFDDETSIYSELMTAGEHYTLAGSGFVLHPAGVTHNPDCGIIDLNNTTITFIKDQPVLASKKLYTFAITARNHSATPISEITIALKLTQNRIDEDDLVKTYTIQYQLPSADGWVTNYFGFVPNEAMTFPTLEVSITSTVATYLTEMGVWAGEGDPNDTEYGWKVPGMDVGANVEFYGTTRPTTILSIGGVDGAAVELLADESYLYLRSVDQIGSYYVGEWGRQMLVCLVDGGEKYLLYINGTNIITINKNDAAKTGVVGEYGIFYISPLFKSIDISTIAVYKSQLPEDIMKLHYVFGGGPKYADVAHYQPYQNAFIADGSSVQFSGHTLFPQSHSFDYGSAYGVEIVNNTLTLPDYPLPTLRNAEYSEINYNVSSAADYSLLTFKIPEGAFMEWRPLVDVGSDINYIFIDVASLLENNTPENHVQKICTIESDTTDYVLEFFLDIDISDTGDFDSNDFAGMFSTEYTYGFATAQRYGAVYANMRNDTETVEVFRQPIIQTDFSLIFNIEKLRDYDEYSVAMMFSDPSFRIIFDHEPDLKALSCSTRDNLLVNNILHDNETDLDAIQIDSRFNQFGTDTRGILQNSTYSVYPNVSIVDGSDVVFLDRSANGYWRANIPLVNLAASVDGKPDLDFVVYSDSERVPQIVTGLNTNRLTYSELQTYIIQQTRAMANPGTHGSAQTLFTGQQYQNIGLNVQNVVPTLGRFANPAVQTFVTLDSQSIYPYKDYTSLTPVKATKSMYIDFSQGPSITTSKWEIFNGFGIRIAQDITLAKYELGYAVHLHSPSLTLQQPVVRSADFFGVASGTNISNSITTSNGSKIYVSNIDNNGIKTPYSVHIPTDTVASAHMPKMYGFFPNSELGQEGDGNIVYQFTPMEKMNTIAFYMLWRMETFMGSTDNVGIFKYINDSNAQTTNSLQLLAGIEPTRLGTHLQFSTPGPSIYIDGVLDGTVWVNKWHLVHIAFTDVKSNLIYSQLNSNVVTNFVAGSNKSISSSRIYASRAGTPTLSLTDGVSLGELLCKGRIIVIPFDEANAHTDFDFRL